MASGPITSCQIEEEKVEEVTDFIFLGSKITVHHDCSCEIKRHLPFKKKLDLGIRSHYFMANRRGKSGRSDRFYFLGLQNH